MAECCIDHSGMRVCTDSDTRSHRHGSNYFTGSWRSDFGLSLVAAVYYVNYLGRVANALEAQTLEQAVEALEEE